MKLLIDENISRKVVESVSRVFPGSRHVFDTGLCNTEDVIIREYAARNDFVILSKDSDFHDMSILHGIPPKIVWIKRGNCSTKEIEALILENENAIKRFIDNSERRCLIIL